MQVHPFYGPNARLLGGDGTSASGVVSMAAYLAFWAAAIAIARRELDARFPRGADRRPQDSAMVLLRERFARGEIDAAQFQSMAAVLRTTEGEREEA